MDYIRFQKNNNNKLKRYFFFSGKFIISMIIIIYKAVYLYEFFEVLHDNISLDSFFLIDSESLIEF